MLCIPRLKKEDRNLPRFSSWDGGQHGDTIQRSFGIVSPKVPIARVTGAPPYSVIVRHKKFSKVVVCKS